MSALALEQRPQTEPTAPQLFKPTGSTLEDLVLGAWEDLAVSGTADCPVCGNALQPRGCASCGSGLS